MNVSDLLIVFGFAVVNEAFNVGVGGFDFLFCPGHSVGRGRVDVVPGDRRPSLCLRRLTGRTSSPGCGRDRGGTTNPTLILPPSLLHHCRGLCVCVGVCINVYVFMCVCAYERFNVCMRGSLWFFAEIN